MTVGAIILAAGASSRMGSPKAALRFRGETFLGGLSKLYSQFCRPVVAVTGYHADTVSRCVDPDSGVILTRNPAPERGMLSSLQCGLRSLPGGLDGFLFTPVDLPRVSPGTVRLLLERFEASRGSRTCIPVHDGRNGHPVICPASLAAEFLALGEEDSPKSVISAHADQVERVAVDDTGAIHDIDTPRDYQELRS